MFFGNNDQAEKQKGKRTSGFACLTFFIQPVKMESLVWAGMSLNKKMNFRSVENKNSNQWLLR